MKHSRLQILSLVNEIPELNFLLFSFPTALHMMKYATDESQNKVETINCEKNERSFTLIDMPPFSTDDIKIVRAIVVELINLTAASRCSN
jgi:hypothetical protein